MKIRNAILSGLIAFGVIACGPSLNDKIKTNEDGTPANAQEYVALLDSTEKGLFAGALMRELMANPGGKLPEDLTYQDILDNGKQWQKEKEEREAREAKEREIAEREAAEARKEAEKIEKERLERLNNTLVVTPYKKGFVESNYRAGRYEDYVSITVKAENRSDKKIRAFQGSLEIYDVFGELIFTLNLKDDDVLKPGATGHRTYYFEYNQFTDSHKTLKAADKGDLTYKWIHKTIILDGGEILN